ncbi:ataxin-7-like protein 2a isoform X2 [Anguilla anguilla]|uniref:ataxin-7-like protein 2a isoform X2 n=1 Tax=Anguilla anguilla TaxID=7936 RepID=UPI0015ABB70B|nr:ataxin-7-like protein 2a isoform X2 [Anguilla anguilla]
MMAVRERAVAVMAALDRRVPSLDDFVGQSWSSWVERANVFVSDAGSDAEECSKNGKKKMDTMTLQREDMSVFGQCPAQDDFYLVVCSHCGQVVKPQAFEKHCERRHGPLCKPHGRLHAPLQRPRPPSAHGTSHAARDGRHQGAGPPRAPPQPLLTAPQYRHGKAQEVAAGVSQAAPPSNCNIKQPPPSDSPPESPAPSLRDPPWPHGGTPPGTTPPSEKPLQRRGEPGRSPNLLAPLRGPRTYKKVSRKECDLDKHCGVLDPERKMLCTRLLTCNIHSIHQRRKVLGRSKNFDQLVAELKMGSKAREWSAQSREGAEACLPAPEPSGDKTGPPHCRRQLGKSTVFSRSRTSSESAPEEERARPEDQEAQPLSPPAHSRLSSEESEGEGQEEPPDWHSTPAHPKPLALCSFGSHAIGRGVFTFDRRLHHLRSAVSAMVERHLSAHLWRKMPQATDAKSQRTSVRPSVTASTDYSSQHSTVSTARGVGNHSASSFRTSSSSNGGGKEVRPQNCSPSPGTACGPSESTGGGRPIASPVPANAPSPSGVGPRPRNPVGRPSKQQTRLRQAEHGTPSRKRRASPHEDGSPRHERSTGTPVPQGPGRLPVSGRTAPSPHGPINGSLSPGRKPRTQAEPRSPSPGLFKRAPPPVRLSPDPASRGRGGDSGVHSKAVSYDHKGLGRTCKGGGPSPPKIHRMPSSSHSGFFSWKKDGTGGALSTGLEKKLGTQKPKLHH